MVRINLVAPSKLADQHLIAEYNEVLMLTAHIKKYPQIENIPNDYCLGKGHMKFFKDKLIYMKKRHETLRDEMKKRNFKANKSINLNSFKRENRSDWKPSEKNLNLIKKRIIRKLKLKPEYYKYYGENKSANFFINLLRS